MKASYLNIFILMALLLSCNLFRKKEPVKENDAVDAFYTDRGGFGTYRRIPLVKPYEAIQVAEKEWRIELQVTQDLLELSIHNVKEINVQDSIVMVYSAGGTSIRHTAYEEAWFVLIPSQNVEKGFSKKEDFLSYLNTLAISDPKLYNADLVYDKFNKTRNIKWDEGF